MNQAIADIIKTNIEDLSFVDKIAGLVSPVIVTVRDKENNEIEKIIPVACCVTADDCKDGSYNELMPDSKYKSVIYFEDKGVTFNRHEGRFKYYTSNVRLVCWLNVGLILGDDCGSGNTCTYAATAIAGIIRALPTVPADVSPFVRVFSEVMSQEIRSKAIFSAYTYDEKHSQYLMYPYDYFALDIQTTYGICLTGTDVYDASC